MLIRFGSFELDEERFELRRDGVPIALQPLVLETLFFLVRNSQQLVTKDQLIAGPWRGTLVSDAALTRVIRQARVALGDDPRAPRFIETVRGKGFRFCSPLDERHTTTRSGEASDANLTTRPTRAFYGRQRELEQLRLAANEAVAQRGNLVLIHGPAGVGKTRLVEWFTSLERERGAEICWGGCREGQTAPPYWPWPEVISRIAESRDEDALRRLAHGRERDLVALVPEFAEAFGVTQPRIGDEGPHRAHSVLDAVTGFLRRAGAGARLILVLEDLHLADDAALELWEVLARSLGDTRLLVIGTCRSTEARARPKLERTLKGALPHMQARQLQGLGLDEVRTWLSDARKHPVPEAIASTLHYSTEGHPLLIENLLEVLPEDWSEPASGRKLPDKLQAALSRRLTELDPLILSTLRFASAFGEEFPISTLALASGEALQTFMPRLQTAVDLGLLRPAAHGTMRFAHALHRDALYQKLEATERPRIHLNVARAFAGQLAHRPDLIVPCTQHFIQAIPVAPIHEVVTYASRAAEWARAKHAYAVAEGYYKQALEALELGSPDPRARCELLVELAEMQCLAGNVPGVESTLQRAFELSRDSEQHDLFTRALLIYFNLRRDSVAVDPVFHTLLAEALRVPQKKDLVYARLQTARAMATVLTHEASERATWLEEALTITETNTSIKDRLEIILGSLRGNTYFTRGTSLLKLANEMLRLAQQAHASLAELEAGHWRAQALIETGRGLDFFEQVEKSEQLSKSVQSPNFAYATRLLLFCREYMLGDLARSELLARDANDLGSPLIGIAASGYLCGQLLIVALERSELERRRLLEEAYDLAERVLGEAPGFRLMEAAMALLKSELGRQEEARELIQGIYQGPLDPLDRNSLPTLTLIARTALNLDLISLMPTLLNALHRYTGRHVVASGGSVYLGPVDYWRGRLNLSIGNRAKAHEQFNRALRDSRQACSVTFQGWTEYYLALTTADSNRRTEAIESARRRSLRYGIGALGEILQ